MEKFEKELFENYIQSTYRFTDDIKSMKTIKKAYKKSYYYSEKSYGKYINNKNLKVLEIGFGWGRFAYFCSKKGINKYVGIDISKEEFNLVQKRFPKYNFWLCDALQFLKENKLKFDVIYMSHVLEHFDLKSQIKLVKLIKNSLSPNGVYINSMPNSASYFGACAGRYADVTHKQTHTMKSFNQILWLAGFKNIIYKNNWIGRNIFEHIVHKIFINLYHLFVRLLGGTKQVIYTPSIITICKND